MCWVWARENALIIVFLLNSFFVAKMKTRLVYTVYWLSIDLQTQIGENALKLRGGKGGRRPPPPTHLMTEKYPIPCLCLPQPLAKIGQQIKCSEVKRAAQGTNSMGGFLTLVYQWPLQKYANKSTELDLSVNTEYKISCYVHEDEGGERASRRKQNIS